MRDREAEAIDSWEAGGAEIAWEGTRSKEQSSSEGVMQGGEPKKPRIL
jgi:hypothetical protein